VIRSGALGDELTRVTNVMVDQGVQYLPSLGMAILLLLAGWIAAKLLRVLTGRLLVALDVVVSRILRVKLAERMRLARSADVLGSLVFWAVLLAFAAAAAHVLGLPIVTQWLARLLDYVPGLITGVLIIVAGYMLARVIADVILRAPGTLGPAQKLVAARAAQVSIVIAALLVGAEQVGIRITFLAIIAGVAAVAVVGGLMIAISLGARTHVANLIGAQQLAQHFRPGQRIRIAGYEGRILELTARGAVLETPEGRVVVPGRLFSEQVLELLDRSSLDG
jgi:hypothetical protein